MDLDNLKNKVEEKKSIYPNPDCPYCNEYERFFDKIRVIYMIGIIVVGAYLIYSLREQVRSDCCQALKACNQQLGYQNLIPDKITYDVELNKTTQSTLNIVSTTQTTTTCPPCPTITTQTTLPCPDCEICPTCEVCTCKLTPDVEKELLNWHLTHSEAPVCQRCASLAKRELLGNILQLDGVAKYNEGPSMGAQYLLSGVPIEEETYCFQNLGNYLILNRTPDENGRKRWGWNDEQCKGSVLRVNHL